MPKRRRLLSIILVVWLCVMLVAFTYTWVSRNWTPSIVSDDINIASSGALVISVLSDTSAVYEEVNLNEVAVGVGIDSNFTFRQVSSQNGINFFWKDFSPTLEDGEAFYTAIGANDTHKKDYIEAQFCLKLDDSLDIAKHIFIHPDTMIKNIEEIEEADLKKAIRISLTYDKDIVTESGVQTVTQTVILGHLDDNTSVINANGSELSKKYMAVLSDADGKTNTEGALGYQTVYGLQYFNCGRVSFDSTDKFSEANYSFNRDPERALFTLEPGKSKWITMRVWLEGQDEDNCIKEIAGKKFQMVLKFDSAFVKK